MATWVMALASEAVTTTWAWPPTVNGKAVIDTMGGLTVMV